MIFRLQRFPSLSGGTFGVLFLNDYPVLTTLERPWVGNTKNQSCIPPAAYECVRHQSPTFGETFMLERVPGRSHILFHAGNTAEDTEGCILLGRGFGRVQGKPAITQSKQAMMWFMSLTDGYDRIYINIDGGLSLSC